MDHIMSKRTHPLLAWLYTTIKNEVVSMRFQGSILWVDI